MRIGIDIRMHNYSGIGTYIQGLIKGLAKVDRDNEYYLVHRQLPGNRPDEDMEKITPLPANFKLCRIKAGVFSLREQWELFSLLKKEEIGLFHFPHFSALFFCPCPMIVTIHDLIPRLFPEDFSLVKRSYYHLMITNALKRAKKIIAVSRNTKNDIVGLFRTPEEKIQVLYEGANEDFRPLDDAQALKHIRQKYHIEGPYLFYAGVKKPHKNLLRLIQAFGLIKKNGGKEKLVIAGKEDPRYPLEKEIKKRNLEKEIILTGFIPRQDLVLLYNGAVAFVFPSLYEGFGLPILEAMACGKPVIASRCASIPEIADDAAILINPYSVEDLAGAIRNVLDNPALRDSLSRKALERASHFSWLKMSANTLRIYEEIYRQK